MTDNTNTPALDISDIKAFDMALDILNGFLPLSDTPTTQLLLMKTWQIYMDGLPTDQLSAIYNESAEGEGPKVSELADRLCAYAALTGMIDQLFHLRHWLCEKDDPMLWEQYKLREIQDLETYLLIASRYVTQTHQKDGETRYFDVESIVEAARLSFENTPLIGAPKDTPSPKTGPSLN